MSGYHFLFVPGPSNVPAAVQQAIHCPMEDHRNPTIPDLIQPITQDLKKILRTETGKVVFFPSSGTGCWEAALQSTLMSATKFLELVLDSSATYGLICAKDCNLNLLQWKKNGVLVQILKATINTYLKIRIMKLNAFLCVKMRQQQV